MTHQGLGVAGGAHELREGVRAGKVDRRTAEEALLGLSPWRTGTQTCPAQLCAVKKTQTRIRRTHAGGGDMRSGETPLKGQGCEARFKLLPLSL